MTRRCAVLLILLAGALSAHTQDDFFDSTVVHEIRLRINPSDWSRLRAHYLEDTYFEGIWQWKDVTLKGVGVRSRGRGSRSPIKPALRIDFNRYEPGQEFLGLKSIQLKNNSQDASQLRERLSMLMFRRMGLPASREAHARLYVNGAYAGLYLMVEPVDKGFLKRNLKENDGHLYQYISPAGPYTFEYLGPDPSRYVPSPFKPETREQDPQPGPLVAFIEAMNRTPDADFENAMREYLDLKRFVRHVAIEHFLAEGDGILHMNNFFLYRLEKRIFNEFLVWDKDSTFTWPERSTIGDLNDNVLMRRAFAIPEIRRAYLEALLECAALAGGEGGWLEQEIEYQYAQIRDAAREDTFKQCGPGPKPCTNEEFEEAVERLIQFARRRTEFVLNEVKEAGFAAGLPKLYENGARNAVSGSPVLSPGGLGSLYGERMTSVTESTELPAPVQAGGVTVLVNGFPAPLLYVSPTQVNFQVPWEVRPGIVRVAATTSTGYAGPIWATIAAESPGVLAAAHADGAAVSSANPAAAGETLVVYATGLGALKNPVRGGAAAPADPPVELRKNPGVMVADRSARVSFAGLAPGFVGLYQVNFTVPPISKAGPDTPLMISAGDRAATLIIATR